MYLQEHGISSCAKLTACADTASEKIADIRKHIKAAKARIDEIAQLRKQIVSYARTREVFAAYNTRQADTHKSSTTSTQPTQHGTARLSGTSTTTVSKSCRRSNT